MFVAEWMTRDVITVTSRETMAVAARLLAKHHIRQLPVVQDQALVGLVTKSDLLRACPSDLNPFSLGGAVATELAGPIRQIMTTEVITAKPESPLEHAAHVLIDRRINSLPVVSGPRLVGILTGLDISRALLAALGAGARGVRITLEVGDGEDVFARVGALAAKHEVRVRSVAAFEHEGKHIAVLRLDEEREGLLDDLWNSGYRIASVARFG
jgi:acetoin utilization protein AcuB